MQSLIKGINMTRISSKNFSRKNDENAPPGQVVTDKFPVLTFGSTPSIDLTDWKFSHSISLVIILLVTIIEICLYISFFQHMYKHDNCTRLARIIEPAIIHKRNKQNAISFFGYWY